MRETRYEVGRTQDVLQFAAIEALKDDGQIFSCDVSPQGKARKIFTLREPILLALAITPFNHPLNQVAHKLSPAIAAGVPVILKPSEKTPLSAIRFAEILYEAGLPNHMLSVILGDIQTVVEPLIADEKIELVTFTGGTEVGKRIATLAGYKKLCLELGGNSGSVENLRCSALVRVAHSSRSMYTMKDEYHQQVTTEGASCGLWHRAVIAARSSTPLCTQNFHTAATVRMSGSQDANETRLPRHHCAFA